jgi:hypothetical protein
MSNGEYSWARCVFILYGCLGERLKTGVVFTLQYDSICQVTNLPGEAGIEFNIFFVKR